MEAAFQSAASVPRVDASVSPERKNAITSAMYQTIADTINAAEADAEVRVVLVTGKPEIFTAGNDLDDFLKTTAADDGIAFTNRPVQQFMRALFNFNKPVAAAVNGAAIGIGTTLLMQCDLVYAADNAKFSVPFAKLGLCPEFDSSMRLPANAGAMLTGPEGKEAFTAFFEKREPDFSRFS